MIGVRVCLCREMMSTTHILPRPERPGGCCRSLRVRSRRVGLAGILAGFALVFSHGCGPREEARQAGSAKGVGGRLVTALRAEPRTLNPATAFNRVDLTVIDLMCSDLIHLNRVTLESEGRLASHWEVKDGGRRFVLDLRPDVRFSDGEPFDADDVLFTFEVLLDERVGAPNRGLLIVDDEPVKVRKLGSHRVEIEMAAPFAGAEQFFDSLLILPKHALEPPYREGRLADAWGLDTPAAEIVGLGPFRLKDYRPGEQLVLERNPYYWRVDAEGEKLPYLDEVAFLFVPTEDAQVIRFQSGEIDVIDHLGAESFTLLAHESGRGYEMQDLGAGLEFSFLFFNLNDVDASRLPEIARKQGYFRRRAFRKALSAAIDRPAIVRLVYQGRATALASHITPGNKLWTNAALKPSEPSLPRAREILAAEGFSWNGQGSLLDPEGRDVEFTIVTNSSNNQRVQMATIIQEDLRRLGVRVQVTTLEFRALIDRLTSSFDYEAAILSLTGNLDPSHFTNVWRSDGNNRLWRLEKSSPEPAWQLEIDRLLDEQMTLVDRDARKAVYDRVQEILAEEEPVILLVSPNVLVGASQELRNFTPSVIPHPTLWNADMLYWPGGRSPARR